MSNSACLKVYTRDSIQSTAESILENKLVNQVLEIRTVLRADSCSCNGKHPVDGSAAAQMYSNMLLMSRGRDCNWVLKPEGKISSESQFPTLLKIGCYFPLPTKANCFREQESMYKVLTPNIKPPI